MRATSRAEVRKQCHEQLLQCVGMFESNRKPRQSLIARFVLIYLFKIFYLGCYAARVVRGAETKRQAELARENLTLGSRCACASVSRRRGALDKKTKTLVFKVFLPQFSVPSQCSRYFKLCISCLQEFATLSVMELWGSVQE